MAQANRSIEVGTGLFVLLGFVALGFLTTQLPGSGLHLKRASESYAVTAKFDDIGGLKVGAPVTMSGVSGWPGRCDWLRHVGKPRVGDAGYRPPL
jgi:phospholipid/cholesterol/gamma-HCH transport system substrate-binding protein